MTPISSPLEAPYTPLEAARRLYLLCDELEQRQVAGEVVAELRLLSERFTAHLQGLPVLCQRIEQLARAMQP